MWIEPLEYGDRKVYRVGAFNRGIAAYLGKVPEVWVEGEVTELRHNPAWATVFLTLKDTETGDLLPVTIRRSTYERLELDLEEGESVHVLGRAELFVRKGEIGFRATSIERLGLGGHLLALERLRRALAAEGLFASERKRPLPRFPRAVGVLTGADAAARGDLIRGIGDRYPAGKVVVCETRVQGPGAPRSIVAALQALAVHPEVDVVVLARGGGSLEDLLPFSDEAVVRAVAACPVPVVSAVGHEQDTPLSDLAADVRASTPTAAARLVVPDQAALDAGLARTSDALRAAVAASLGRAHESLVLRLGRAEAATRITLERRRAALDRVAGKLDTLSPRATLARGYAIVRAGGEALRDAASVAVGERLAIELATGSLVARVEEVGP